MGTSMAARASLAALVQGYGCRAPSLASAADFHPRRLARCCSASWDKSHSKGHCSEATSQTLSIIASPCQGDGTKVEQPLPDHPANTLVLAPAHTLTSLCPHARCIDALVCQPHLWVPGRFNGCSVAVMPCRSWHSRGCSRATLSSADLHVLGQSQLASCQSTAKPLVWPCGSSSWQHSFQQHLL